jgi:hypothetical protein
VSYTSALDKNSAASSFEGNVPNDGTQVYGATSLLHDQSSETPWANRRQISTQDPQYLGVDTMKDKLISNAALRKQEEFTLKNGPSVVRNIDFDSVPMDLAMHLLDLHWNREHLSYLLTYRPAIMDSLVRSGPYVNKLLLNSIYLQSSLYSDRGPWPLDSRNQNSKGLVFYGRFKFLLPNYLDRPTLPTVVALLTCGSCIMPYGCQSAGWALSGMGYRLIIDLACHLDSPASSKLTAIEQEMKKRVYWGAFMSDKFQSLFLGRPPAISESTGNVSHELFDSFEELEEWTPYSDPQQLPASSASAYPARLSYAISTFQSLLSICKIASYMIETFYSVNSVKIPKATLLQAKDRITNQLTHWRESLPSWLHFYPSIDTTPPPHQIIPQ